ncbi:MAG: peptide chain release factor N(5)-glutamine methyltransferase [Christensenellaceae bacterium]|nr:peptide chain release factor N(5)-glutamine methyltransferase [Christensenellaceae bacterium]
MDKKKTTKIGGQAVLEGVMMRGKSVMATSVRDPSGTIQTESQRFVPFSERSVFFKMPIIRGIISFAISMVTGMKTLMRAAEVFSDVADEKPSKFETWLAEKTKINIMSVISILGTILGIVVAVGLFVLLPGVITDGIYTLFPIDAITELWQNILKNLTSGLIRIIIFIAYILLCSLLKDIKRLFSYHGAEHKTISCYESGKELTVANARETSRIHDRCGTTFMILVMIIGIIFFSFLGWQELWMRMLIRIAGIPIVAGISYEILMFLARFDNPLVKVIKLPGLLLQKVTTREPDDEMLEVAITAFKTVLAMEDDKNIPETKFETAYSIKKAEEQIRDALGELYSGEEFEILMAITGVKTREELKTARLTNIGFEKALAVANDRLSGKPLQYALGETCFYGLILKSDPRALIARSESELLAEQAIIVAKNFSNPKIIDMCTGSGSIAIAIAKNVDCQITAIDISEEAIELASENAQKNDVEIKFYTSDMFENITDTYDIIVVNPPYIKTADIEKLDASVRDYEPHNALDGGSDGLVFYRDIALKYKKFLNKGGFLILEVGCGQSDAVDSLFGGISKRIKDYNTPPVERVLVIKDEELVENDI